MLIQPLLGRHLDQKLRNNSKTISRRTRVKLPSLYSAKGADVCPEAGTGARGSLRGTFNTRPVLRGFLKSLALFLSSAAALLYAQTPTAANSVDSVSSLFPQLESYVQQAMAKTGVPGVAVAIVYRDKVVYLKGFGVRKAGEGALVDPDTVFQLASVSKPIASTIIASLVGTGEIGWDQPIVTLDPGFKLSDPNVTAQVTIRDFLCHRSGLPTMSGDTLEDLGFSRPEILYKMRLLPLTGQFRKTYAYSNFGFTEAGIAASKAVHQTWEDLADQRLFKPLGMTSTSYRNSEYEDSPDKAAIHVIIDGKPIPRYKRYPDAEAPAGSAHSSVRDLAEWLRLQLANGQYNGEQIVAADALNETHSPQIQTGTNPPAFYGLGWNVNYQPDGKLILGHSGAFFIGTNTAVRLSPSDQLAIAVLTNAQPTGLPEAVTLTFFDLYMHGKPSQEWLTIAGDYYKALIESDNNAVPDYSKLTPPSSPAPGQALSAYVGTYRNAYYGTIDIFEQNNALWLRLPAQGALYTLSHWDGDTFTYRFEAEQGIGTRAVAFNLSGTPQVTIDNLTLEGDGTFKRIE
jgi:CubicO group peptidase (beta-lactamase class C family)